MALPSLWRRGRNDRDVTVRRAENPFLSLQREMNSLFEEFWRGFDLRMPFGDGEWSTFEPRIDLEETADSLFVTAELPGLDEKDFEVSLDGDLLVLRGEKRVEREDKAAGWHERSYGSFHRAIALPCEVDVDKVSARFKNGVLRVDLPKAPQAREQRKRIPVSAS